MQKLRDSYFISINSLIDYSVAFIDREIFFVRDSRVCVYVVKSHRGQVGLSVVSENVEPELILVNLILSFRHRFAVS
jgi:hypothetical protein